MKITTTPSAFAAPFSAGQSATSAPEVVEPPEHDLATLGGTTELFGGPDPVSREESRKVWSRELNEYLEYGYLEVDADPVVRCVEGASHPGGVERGKKNLKLQEGARVIGFLDNECVGDAFYICRQEGAVRHYYTVTIESGVSTNGPYDISVEGPMDWSAFAARVSAM